MPKQVMCNVFFLSVSVFPEKFSVLNNFSHSALSCHINVELFSIVARLLLMYLDIDFALRKQENPI